MLRASTVPGATSWGMGRTVTVGFSWPKGAQARTELVVPRSIPIANFAAMGRLYEEAKEESRRDQRGGASGLALGSPVGGGAWSSLAGGPRSSVKMGLSASAQTS